MYLVPGVYLVPGLYLVLGGVWSGGVSALGGGVPGPWGCLVQGGVWSRGCLVQGGCVPGPGVVWSAGVCLVWGGVCSSGGTCPGTPPNAEHAGRYGQRAGGTHPTGMHSWLISRNGAKHCILLS